MEDRERRQALADFLKTRRARLSPSDVGLPAGLRRRTPGLRREEIAQLANIGTSWYIALEQGRDVQPSEQVLDSLAQALRLSFAERRHLHLLAQPPSSTERYSPPEEIVSHSLTQAVQALHPHPTYVLGRRWACCCGTKRRSSCFPFQKLRLRIRRTCYGDASRTRYCVRTGIGRNMRKSKLLNFVQTMRATLVIHGLASWSRTSINSPNPFVNGGISMTSTVRRMDIK
ncbi:hypothetical protein PAESOLCIP111_00363 [Paenibacillus solanacearum]|uniref:HTH cro/C1-type domain-containing protein n=1 Tax=Paenibacillus solanacearum TaxID=2048548 RepID=A0A916NF47_9BACL|nr:hypothetical protein PAESOLCIP111_00363 [Paenibacillus solanacearum]